MQMTLKAIRVHRNLKQTDMANALNVNRKTISAWESGKAMPTVDKVDAICALLGVSYNDIQWRV